jgi:hypothetical protein
MNAKMPYVPLSSDNAALVLVDHQVGLLTGVRDITVAELKSNVVSLAMLRMQQAGVILSDYATLAIEILKDNSRPDAGAVYAALAMPFAVLVGQIAHAYGK